MTEELTTHRDNDFITKELEGLALINSIIIPRPIAFVTTLNDYGGVNAAPFSYFTIVCTNPVMISIAIERREGQRKDTAHNILTKKEFVVNICSMELAKTLSKASAPFPPHISEVDVVNLTLLPSKKTKVPRIAHTFIQLECHLERAIELGNDPSDLIIGNVLCSHIHKDVLNTEGVVDSKLLNPLARLGECNFSGIHSIFSVPRPSKG